MYKVRGCDAQGCGHFGAPRGSRTHNGVDLIAGCGDIVRSLNHGIVTKLGLPYEPDDPAKGHLRYVQVTDEYGLNFRYFYIEPLVEVGQEVIYAQPIGIVQGLTDIYKGITDHFHLEIKIGDDFVNPTDLLKLDIIS